MTHGTATGTGTGRATDAWAAGFEMGRLDQQLAARVLRDRRVGLTILRVNRDEAAVIARRHGYELHLHEVEEPGHVWAEFWPTPGPAATSPRPARASAPRCP